MHISNNQVQGRTGAGQTANHQHSPQTQRSGSQNFRSGGQFNTAILFLFFQLIQQLLQLISQQQPEPKPDPNPLELKPHQQNNLKELLGFSKGAPVGVEVLDEDGSGTISAGDTAIASGGITGGELNRKTLTAEDVAKINQTQSNVPQAFTDNLQKWQGFTSDPETHLSYTTQQSCFCPQEFTRPMNVTEFNGEITSATYADTNEPVPDNIRQALRTVDERFEQLQDAYENGADTVNVQYDPQFGYPTSVFIDRSQMIADEEVSYTISDLGIALP